MTTKTFAQTFAALITPNTLKVENGYFVFQLNGRPAWQGGKLLLNPFVKVAATDAQYVVSCYNGDLASVLNHSDYMETI